MPDPDEFKVSQFKITPCRGTVQPNGDPMIVNIDFDAQGAKFYESQLYIHINGRDSSDQPEGLSLKISGESCIPGINAVDLDHIFEE